MAGEANGEIKVLADKAEFPGFSGFDYNKKNGNYVNESGKLNVLGVSCTTVPSKYKKNRSTSMATLELGLKHVQEKHKCNSVMVNLMDLEFGFCEGYYSSDKKACEWPCTVSDRDGEKDKMDIMYYGMTEWADIIVLSTPIRYGNPTALYFKMIERLNTIHNQITLHDKHLIKDKVACFIITGGQDGIQQTAGHMLTLWSEFGYHFPRYSYAAWTRGWYAENMKKSFDLCLAHEEFNSDIKRMIDGAVDLKRRLNETETGLDFADDEDDPYKKISYEDYDPATFFVKQA